MKSLYLTTAVFCCLLSGCQLLKQPQKPVISSDTQVKFAQEAETIIRQQLSPSDALYIKAKDKDLYVRAIENASVSKLQSKGYAVQLVLPVSERQKGDSGSYNPEGTEISLDYIPYKQSKYSELVVNIDGVRYSRLYAMQGTIPQPVSNWICRTSVHPENSDDLGE